VELKLIYLSLKEWQALLLRFRSRVLVGKRERKVQLAERDLEKGYY